MTKILTPTNGKDQPRKCLNELFEDCSAKANLIFLSLESLIEPFECEAGYGLAHIIELLAKETESLKGDIAVLETRMREI